MIKVPFPHMALNSTDALLLCARWPRPDHILEWTAVVAQGAPGGKLATLVISCHGLLDEDDRAGFGLDLCTGPYADPVRWDWPLATGDPNKTNFSEWKGCDGSKVEAS